MKVPENVHHLLFGGTFVLSNKLQCVGDKLVDGLSTKQWFLLRNLMDFPKESPPTITQIAKSMDSTRQNVSQMLELMEREGWVTIENSLLDHRSLCVCITEEGLACAKQTAKNAQFFLDHLFEDIELSDCSIAGKVMIKMLQNLEKMQVSP